MRKPPRDRVRAKVAEANTRTLLVRTARRVLSPEDSEDAAHDAVVQALVHADKFREDAQVGTWLYRIAFNAALVRQRCSTRTTKRLQRVRREGEASVDGVLPAPTVGPREVEEIELKARLREAVAQLPEAYRTVIQRCVYDEQRPDDVAAALGITPSAMRTRITRAREQLRALMSAAEAACALQARAA